jgi:hypothetical protein
VTTLSTMSTTATLDHPGSMVGPGQSRFDAYVSYCDSDEDWALSELIMPLRNAGIKLIHKGDFELGVPKIEAHSDAVAKSRKVLIVVTPALFASEWDNFDTLIAQAPNQSGLLRRLIPLIVHPCELPPRIAALVQADFTDPNLRKEAFDRLLRSLGRSPDEINESTASAAKKGISALAELLRYPTVQVHLRSYQEAITEASDLIRVLGRYKRLHDYFQRVEGAFKLLLQCRKSISAGVDTWDELEEVARELANELGTLLEFARDGGFPPNEVLWTSRLERMCLDLITAAQEQDDGKLGGICEKLLKVIGSQPARINDRLVTTAKQLALGAVADTLRKISAAVADMPLDEEAQAWLGQFTTGIDSLGQLDRNLGILINNHNCLQEIDDSLRSFEATLHPSPAEIAEVWVDLSAPLGLLNADYGATWIAGLRELGQIMNEQVARPPTEPKAVREFQSLFRNVRDKIFRGFNQTDEDLRRFCDQLQKVGDTLSNSMWKVQHV